MTALSTKTERVMQKKSLSKYTQRESIKAPIPIILYFLVVLLFKFCPQSTPHHTLTQTRQTPPLQLIDTIPKSEKKVDDDPSNLNTHKKSVPPPQINQKKKNIPKRKINLNQCDSLQLIRVRGIGPVFSKRILKYRKILGGYIHVNQLKEIYGMKEETYDNIKNDFFVEKSFVPDKIPFKTVSFKALLRHPYCDYNMTKILINYRNHILKKDSTFSVRTTTEYLQNIHGIDSSKLNHLIPYLK